MRRALLSIAAFLVGAASVLGFANYQGWITATHLRALLKPSTSQVTTVSSVPTVPRGKPLAVEATPARKGRLFAVVIGIDRYADKTIPPLQFAANDAREISQALQAQKGALYGDVHVVTLTNKDATRSGIVDALFRLTDTPLHEDTTVLFFSGHALSLQRSTGRQTSEHYFVPYDGDITHMATSGISYREIVEYVERAKGRKMIFLDTARSGSMAVDDPPGLVNSLLQTRSQGITIYTSSLSYESAQWQHGAFTFALLDALLGRAGAPQFFDGCVTPRSLGLWLERRISVLTNGVQAPFMGDMNRTSSCFANVLPGKARREVAPDAVILDVAKAGPGKVLLRYRLDAPAGTTVTDLKLFIDNAKYDVGDAQRAQLKVGVEQSMELTVPPGTHQITLTAGNGAGYGQEATRSFLAAATVASKPHGKLFALVVGINRYKHEKAQRIPRLNYAIADADAVTTLLYQQKGRFFDDVVVRKRVGPDANYKNLVDDLLWLQMQPTQLEDFSVVYFAGHGQTIKLPKLPKEKGIYYFLPFDGNTNPDRANSANVNSALISQFASKFGTRLIFLDTCYSGRVDATELIEDLESRNRQAFVFVSSTGRQRSWELPKYRHGAFTQAFLEGFQGQADNSRLPFGYVTDLGLADWLDRRIRHLTNDEQTPMTGGSRAHTATRIGAVVPEPPAIASPH